MGKIKRIPMQSEGHLLPPIPDLTGEVWRLLQQIPRGRVATYGDLARALGDVGASRFVGQVMSNHDHQKDCCCHRLVRRDGSLGKFVSGDDDAKANLLQKEGLAVHGRRVLLQEVQWNDFRSAAPLRDLAEYQMKAAEAADIDRALDVLPSLVGGVDVSFVPNSNLAVAAFVIVDLSTNQVCYELTHSAPIQFPYISGYLAFRELPILLELLRRGRTAHSLPDVILVDGSGILHPRRAGVATMFGVAADVRTIGITKKHLIGSVELRGLREANFREIRVSEDVCGFALLPRSGTRKPLYVSPGHRIDVATSLAVIQECRLRRRLPEPIYWADRISRAAAKQMAT